MRYVVAILAVLWASSANAQGILFESSYSTPDYGHGYSTTTYGWSGSLGSPLQPYWIETYHSPNYGYGRSSNDQVHRAAAGGLPTANRVIGGSGGTACYAFF